MEALTQTSTGGSEAEEARTDKAREERDCRRGGAKEGADARVERRQTAEERRQEDRTAEEMVVAVADIGDHCGRARSGWMAVGGGRKPTLDGDDVTRVPSPLYRRTAAPRFFYSFTCVCTCESEEKFRFPARGPAAASPRVLFPTLEPLFSPEPSPISSHPPIFLPPEPPPISGDSPPFPEIRIP